VTDAFGPGIEARPGVVDRRALGRIVFTDPAARGRLERIVHPHMADRARQEIARVGGSVLINAAVLHRMGLDRSCDAVICVTSPWPLRFLRATRRDRLSFRDALARLASQQDICPSSGRIQFEGVDVDTYTVRNRGSVRALQDRAAALARRLRG
jgi:dephospho-CoA kinase